LIRYSFHVAFAYVESSSTGGRWVLRRTTIAPSHPTHKVHSAHSSEGSAGLMRKLQTARRVGADCADAPALPPALPPALLVALLSVLVLSPLVLLPLFPPVSRELLLDGALTRGARDRTDTSTVRPPLVALRVATGGAPSAPINTAVGDDCL
jgi:hypothetical protein